MAFCCFAAAWNGTEEPELGQRAAAVEAAVKRRRNEIETFL